MGVLRGITFSTMPPMVSMPRDNGVTSSNKVSDPTVKASACKAAPTATTSSGLMSAKGSRPNRAATRSRTSGTRVDPPTSTTPCTSSTLTPASASTPWQMRMVRATKGSARASKVPRSRRWRLGLPSTSMTHSPTARADRHSLAMRAVAKACLASDDVMEASPRVLALSARKCSAMAWSKSSPPSAASPPVARTWNTPFSMRNSEMSKVPPPRS